MASMLECRNALHEAGGDFDKAKEVLRKKGMKLAEKKADRATSNGVIESYIHSNKRMGVLLDLRCETDFVARTDQFKELAHEIAMQIAATKPSYIYPEEIPAGVIEAEKNIYREQFKDSGKPEKVLEGIIEGKMQKYAEEHALMTQLYVRDDSKTIKDLINEYISKIGENIKVERFVRFEM